MPATDRRALVPGIAMVEEYQRAWLGKDVVAGLVLSALLVPQGMAYAELAGLPPVTGLYTSILCLLGYAVFGPSRVLVLGPDSSLGPMIAATIAPLALSGGDPNRAIALASLLAILVGVIMLVSGLAGLGFIADLLSKPTQIGYMTGLALTIVIGQLPKLCGFSVDANGLIGEAKGFVEGVAHGEVNATAVTIGVASLFVIVVVQRWLPKVPAILVVVVAASLAVSWFNLHQHDVSTIGVLPSGFPPLTLPRVGFHDVIPLVVGAVGIAVVALADTMSTAASFGARLGQPVRGNQEMVGIGAANIAAGLFQGFPVSTSGSRTAVAEQSGSRSQITGVVGAAVIILLLVFVPGLMKNIPQPTLGAIVIAAALSLADIAGARRLWQLRRTEFALFFAAFLGVALLGVLEGIVIAIALSILNVFVRVWWPHQAELGRVAGMGGLHDTGTYPHSELLAGLVVFRFDAPLIFANARTFSEEVREIAENREGVRWILIAAEPITDVDTTAADMLEELDIWLNRHNVSLVIAEMKDPVRAKIEKYELTRVIAPQHFFPTVDEAVVAYMHETGETWHRPDGEEGS